MAVGRRRCEEHLEATIILREAPYELWTGCWESGSIDIHGSFKESHSTDSVCPA